MSVDPTELGQVILDAMAAGCAMQVHFPTGVVKYHVATPGYAITTLVVVRAWLKLSEPAQNPAFCAACGHWREQHMVGYCLSCYECNQLGQKPVGQESDADCAVCDTVDPNRPRRIYDGSVL